MIAVQPPPIYAQVLLTDPSSGVAKFNPIWLDWFTQLAALVNTAATAFSNPVVFNSTATFSSYTDYAQIAQPAVPGTGFTRVSNVSFNAGYGLMIEVPDANLNYLVLNTIGATSGYIGRRANGVSTAPTALALNNVISGIGAQGYGTTGYVAAYSASIQFIAQEAYTDAAGGAAIQFYTTLNGTIVPIENMRVWDNGTVGMGGPLGAESARVLPVAGSTRWVTLAGSAAGNPTIGVSGGKLACSAALVLSQVQLLETSVALTNNAAGNVGTLNNAPAAGNPTKWIPINDNGTVRNIPAW